MRNKSVVLKLNFILEYQEFPGIGSYSPGLGLKWCIVSVFVCFIITCKQGQVLRDPEWHTPPGGVLWISGVGGDRRIFWGRKMWEFFWGWLDLSRDFFGYSKQSRNLCQCLRMITSDGMMKKQTQTINF